MSRCLNPVFQKWPVKGADPRGCEAGESSPPGGEPGSQVLTAGGQEITAYFSAKVLLASWRQKLFRSIMLPLSLFKKRKRDRQRERDRKEMRGREIEGKERQK